MSTLEARLARQGQELGAAVDQRNALRTLEEQTRRTAAWSLRVGVSACHTISFCDCVLEIMTICFLSFSRLILPASYGS